MNGLTSMTPTLSGKRELSVQDIPQLPEVVVEVTNFEGIMGGIGRG